MAHPVKPYCQSLYYYLVRLGIFKRRYTTVMIDLTLGAGIIFKNASKNSVQKNIKRAVASGTKIISVNSGNYYQYGKLLYDSRVRLGIETRPASQLYWDILNLLRTHKNYHAFMAVNGESILAAVGTVIKNKVITEQALARIEEDKYSVDLLRWHIVNYGIKKGCEKYNLAGIKYDTEKNKNIARSKTKWHGEITTIQKS